MALPLDLKDRKILFELDRDSRASFSQIAKKVGLSKEVVNYRVSNLQKNGVIENFFTVIDVLKVGYLPVRVILRFGNSTPELEKEMVDSLLSNPNVAWAVSVQGNWDLNFIFWAESIAQFNAFWKAFLQNYRPFIEEKWISFFTGVYNFHKAFLLEKSVDENQPFFVGGSNGVKPDSADAKILSEISKNARIPLIELANKAGLSEKVVHYRLKRLIKEKVILGFRVRLDLNKIGFLYYKLHLTLKNASQKRYNALVEFCRFHPNVVYIDELIGGADFEMELNVKSNEQFREILTEIRHSFADIIRNFEVLLYVKEYKLIWFPEKTEREKS